jgi:hypothetical protein
MRTYNTPNQIKQGRDMAAAYSSGKIVGWGGEKDAKKEIRKFGNAFHSLPPSANRKAFLWQATRKVLGRDTENYPQESSDCVSFGAKNATEYLTCCEIALGNESNQKFRKVFPPYYYGTSRIYVGRGALLFWGGSFGSWMATAVMKYGTLFSDEDGVPEYSASVADSWGRSVLGRFSLNKWNSVANKFLVNGAALISSWDELVTAITSGYPCTISSRQGFDVDPDSSGFHNPNGTWYHQMCIIGVDDEYSDKYGIILNSWGDIHGELTSFYDSNEKLPVGTLRVRKEVIEDMIIRGECFAFSQFDGFRSSYARF